MMKTNQYAVYQLKEIPENRELLYRSYEELQKNGIQVRYENYEQSYLGSLQPGDTPAVIRSRFNQKRPRNFHGHSISVGDVLVLSQSGVITSYYVEKEGFTVIAGFIRKDSSSALISLNTTDFHIEGKGGKWLAYDSIIVEGKQFFLMEHTMYGADVENVVLDENGKLVVDQVYHGFDETVLKQIRDYLYPPEISDKANKPQLETWQKYYENGEYLRSAELTEEQNYNMIDGRMNNLPVKPRNIGNRISVRDRLHLKQADIEKRSGKPTPQMAATEDMERRQK